MGSFVKMSEPENCVCMKTPESTYRGRQGTTVIPVVEPVYRHTTRRVAPTE
jgi:hypothetical protein